MATSIYQISGRTLEVNYDTWNNIKTGKQRALLVVVRGGSPKQLTIKYKRHDAYDVRVLYKQKVTGVTVGEGLPVYLVSVATVAALQRRRRQKEELSRLARKDAERERWVKGSSPRAPK